MKICFPIIASGVYVPSNCADYLHQIIRNIVKYRDIPQTIELPKLGKRSSRLSPMDPITASTLLATLVQLIGLYRQEMGARKDLTHREFIEWLEVHRHAL